MGLASVPGQSRFVCSTLARGTRSRTSQMNSAHGAGPNSPHAPAERTTARRTGLWPRRHGRFRLPCTSSRRTEPSFPHLPSFRRGTKFPARSGEVRGANDKRDETALGRGGMAAFVCSALARGERSQTSRIELVSDRDKNFSFALRQLAGNGAKLPEWGLLLIRANRQSLLRLPSASSRRTEPSFPHLPRFRRGGTAAQTLRRSARQRATTAT